MYTIQLVFLKEESWLMFLDRVNVSVGESEDRMMMTGLHTVADIFCVGCGSIVGWKYVRFCGRNFENIGLLSIFLVAV